MGLVSLGIRSQAACGRDGGFQERLPVLDSPDGVGACENKFECTRVCPRDIRVTWHINYLKHHIQEFKKK